jgi:hypothetical protein
MSDADCYADCDDFEKKDNTKFMITYNHSKYVIPYEKLSKKIAHSIIGGKKGKTLSDKVRFTIKKQTPNEKPELLLKEDLEKTYYMIIKSLLKSGSLEEYLVKKISPRKRK